MTQVQDRPDSLIVERNKEDVLFGTNAGMEPESISYPEDGEPVIYESWQYKHWRNDRLLYRDIR